MAGELPPPGAVPGPEGAPPGGDPAEAVAAAVGVLKEAIGQNPELLEMVMAELTGQQGQAEAGGVQPLEGGPGTAQVL